MKATGTSAGYELLHSDIAPLVVGISSPDAQFNMGDLMVIQNLALSPP